MKFSLALFIALFALCVSFSLGDEVIGRRYLKGNGEKQACLKECKADGNKIGECKRRYCSKKPEDDEDDDKPKGGGMKVCLRDCKEAGKKLKACKKFCSKPEKEEPEGEENDEGEEDEDDDKPKGGGMKVCLRDCKEAGKKLKACKKFCSKPEKEEPEGEENDEGEEDEDDDKPKGGGMKDCLRDCRGGWKEAQGVQKVLF